MFNDDFAVHENELQIFNFSKRKAIKFSNKQNLENGYEATCAIKYIASKSPEDIYRLNGEEMQQWRFLMVYAT